MQNWIQYYVVFKIDSFDTLKLKYLLNLSSSLN